eukprot:scaffold2765_cov128-Isochrysis_galbana.AAC.2
MAQLGGGEWTMIVASCLNGVAISYAGLRVQQLVTATTFMVGPHPAAHACMSGSLGVVRGGQPLHGKCGRVGSGGRGRGREGALGPVRPPPQ